jgi:ParB-like chromosome segregation protein Spo0J
MKLRNVAPGKIQIPEERVTSEWDPETYRQFQEVYKQMGQTAAITCIEVDGELVLVDGYHRLMEAVKNGWSTIAVVVRDGDMVDVLTENLLIDHLRGKHPVSQMRKVIVSLFKEFKLGIEDIEKKTGLKRDYIESLLIISELTPMCLKALDEGRIGVGHAAALAKLKDPVRQEVVMQQQLLYHWTVKELAAHIADVIALLVEPAEQQAAAPTQDRPVVKVKCRYCGVEYDPADLAAIITCQSCSGVLFGAIAQARQEDKTKPPG